MSEQQEQGTTTYTPEQFEEVRRARHAVRKALSKFFHILTMVEGTDTYAVSRLSRKSQSAMRGRPGFTQEQQVQRFDWVIENIEAIKGMLSELAPEDEIDAKVLDLALTILTERVVPLVEEGRATAADRDFAAYKAAKDAYKGRRGSGYGYSEDVDSDEDDYDEDEDDEDEG